MWDKFSNWMGQGQNQDLFSVLAGGAGAAIAGPDTWQERLGNFAAGQGQSGIADAAGQDQRGKLMELLTAALGGAQPATQGAPAAPGAAPATQNMGDLFSALGPAGVTPYSQQLGAPGIAPIAPAAPTQAAPAVSAAPGGEQSSDPFWRRFF